MLYVVAVSMTLVGIVFVAPHLTEDEDEAKLALGYLAATVVAWLVAIFLPK